MIKRLFGLFILLWVYSALLIAGGNDDPLLTKVIIDQLEVREHDGDNPLVLEAEMWVGKDLNKLWIKTDLEYKDKEIEEAELQLLYSRAIAPYWDVQVGLRHNNKPKPVRNWLALGFKGLAPYYFEVDGALFLGEDGHSALRLQAEYEILFTQKLVLTPEIEANFYGKKDEELGLGSGLSDVSLGLRLRYEIKREFAPYIGVQWSKKYAGTADFAREAGEKIEDTQWVIGIRAWF